MILVDVMNINKLRYINKQNTTPDDMKEGKTSKFFNPPQIPPNCMDEDPTRAAAWDDSHVREGAHREEP